MRTRGNVAIVVALSMVALIAVAAVAVDLGALRVWQVELHNAAEAGAHAGAARLDGTAEGMDAARAFAVATAGANSAAREAVRIEEGDVALGAWTGAAFVAEDDPAFVNAVRVVARRDDLDAFFARLLGRDALATADVAIAVSGGPRQSACPLPIAVPACALDEVVATCNVDASFNDAGADDAGWALLGDVRPSASALRDAVEDCDPAGTADVLSMNNGAVASAAQALAEAVAAQPTFWDAGAWGPLPPRSPRSGIPVAAYGRVLERHVMVFEDPTGCANPSFNGTAVPVLGFATAVVYDVETTGPVDTREVRMRVVCETTEEPGGGGWFGTWSRPHLVEEAP